MKKRLYPILAAVLASMATAPAWAGTPNVKLTLTTNDAKLGTFIAEGLTEEVEGTWTDLTADMFQRWDGYGADAQSVGSVTVDFNVNNDVQLGGGGVVIGTSTVDHLIYPDITGAAKISFTGSPNMSLRVLMNRQESNNGPLTERQVVTNGDGYAELDVSDLPYIHINAIKLNWGASGKVNSVKFLVPATDRKSYLVAANTSVTIKATPANACYLASLTGEDGSYFSNTAVSKNITVAADMTLDATFLEKPILTLFSNDETMGSVAFNAPTGTYVNGANANTYIIDYGTQVTATAQAIVDHEVASWTDAEGNKITTGVTFSNYAVTDPEDDFPAKSVLTLTMTEDVTAKANFRVNSYIKEIEPDWVADLADVAYNGQEQKPTIVVKCGDKTLVEGRDYTVTYTNNLNAGTATVTIAAAGTSTRYIGSITKTFNITKVPISMMFSNNMLSPISKPVVKALGSGAFTYKAVVLLGAVTPKYMSSDPSVATVDANTGRVTLVGAGFTTIYATVENSENYIFDQELASYWLVVTDKKELKAAIKDAKAYKASIADDNPDLAQGLDIEIAAAQAVVDDAEAVQTEIEDAILRLQTSVKKTAAQIAARTTGINSVVTDKDDATWFDLNGRRLQGKPAQKGVYVRDGRKVIVK